MIQQAVVTERLPRDLNRAGPAAAGSSLASPGLMLEVPPGFRAVKWEWGLWEGLLMLFIKEKDKIYFVKLGIFKLVKT